MFYKDIAKQFSFERKLEDDNRNVYCELSIVLIVLFVICLMSM